ncbi:hypothetical protein [Pseudomonas abietaniphila]|uniref:hypothetical protein n=1 Tax=Pseudomonas abietaniphila TaxID=89065 RepID=UPI0007832D9A|nr:hypothetical protein [Pseudomonas abietaniphila]
MQPTPPPKDDGLTVIQRLAPDQFDVVLGSHPAKRKVPPSKTNWPFSSIIICLALLAAIIYLVVQMFHTQKPSKIAIAPTPAEPQEASASVISTADLRTTEQVVYVAPKLETAPPATTQPLNNCLKDGNVIDRDVINCRFGEVQPTDYNAPRPQGMVSERYMAQYKSSATKPKVDTGRRYEVAGVFIRDIDGRNRYEARYRIYNNHIDNSSVCMNFKSDSVEYRECRRAATPFFKDMCSDWTKRVAKDKDEKNTLAQEQYCEAARTYQATN